MSRILPQDFESKNRNRMGEHGWGKEGSGSRSRSYDRYPPSRDQLGSREDKGSDENNRSKQRASATGSESRKLSLPASSDD